MNIKNFIAVAFFTLSIGAIGYTQDYKWTGNAGTTDFFNEQNWGDINTNSSPVAGTIDPSKDINLNLILEGIADAQGIIQLGSGSLKVTNGELTADDISGGSIAMEAKGYITLRNVSPVLNSVAIEFTSSLSWLRTLSVNPSEINSGLLTQIKINQQNASFPQNIRLDNYYTKGTVIRPEKTAANPLSIYSSESFLGTSATIFVDTVYGGVKIPEGLNNNIRSLRLERGYMVTLAVNEDGTGKSQVLIASEEDLEVPLLPEIMAGNISFIRVIPWNWVSKRGTGGNVAGLDVSWYYRWTNSDASDLPREYAPMAWGFSAANDDADVTIYRNKYKATHVLGFNEPDNCNDQSGQYGNLCVPDTAVMYYENLMKTGLRMVSPSGREQAWNGWLNDFYQIAQSKDVRIDVIAVHWYDWGSSPANSPNEDPQKIFTRFKNYLEKVYTLYGLPIWITEFNANPNRSTWVQNDFMKLALPYLEELSYVERYAWFEPVSDVGDYYNTNGAITALGTYYRDLASNPTIPEAIWNESNNLVITDIKENQAKNESAEVNIFPNPVDNVLIVSANEPIEKIVIVNMNGSEVFVGSEDLNSIDVSHFYKGLYVIQVNNITQKFLKL